MEFKLSTYPKGNIIYKNSYSQNFDSNKDIDEIAVKLDTENTMLHFGEKWFSGIHISIVEIDPNKTEYFLFESSYPNIGFLFCLSGAMQYYLNHQLDNQLSLSKYEQNINAGKINAIKFSVTEKTKYIYIQLTESYFNKMAGREFIINNFLNTQESILPEISLMLQHLLSHKHEGRAKRLFLEARIFDLIIIYLNQKQEKLSVVLKQEDVDKILYAKQLVEKDLQKPNSLIELSRKAGINDYKLKKGFKELTGHTVFGYLYKIRMEKAYYLLSKEKRTVNEVAFLVGYKNAQHFIAAFKKQFHVLPGSLNKN